MPYLEIVDILALHKKMVNYVESIHDFEISRLVDSAIHLYLITLSGLLPKKPGTKKKNGKKLLPTGFLCANIHLVAREC